MVRQRRLAGWVLSAALLLAGCQGPPPPPADPAAVVAWSGTQPVGLGFAYPGNWPATARTAAGGEQFVTISATSAERLVIGYLPGQSGNSLEAFAGEITARVREEFPGTLAGEPRAATAAGRPALKLGFQTPAGNRGVRYLITGGWLVEYEARPQYSDGLEPAFEAIVASLTLPRTP